jgi:hypothetical protein
MRTAKCKTCGWIGVESALKQYSDDSGFATCPECDSVELILTPEGFKSKEQIACENVHIPRTIIAADQRQAQIECSMVQVCPAKGCICFLDSIIQSLCADHVISEEEADNLIYGGDEDE